MDFIYRKAFLNDLKEVLDIKNNIIKDYKKNNIDFWNESYPSDELIKEDILSKGVRLLINKENNEILGYVHICDPLIEFDNFYPFKTNNLYYFGRFMIKLNYEKQNLGSIFLAFIINEIKSFNIYKGIGIMVDPKNINAIKLYLKNNFKFIETKQYEFGPYSTYELIF